MVEQVWPSMSGWRKRELKAKERARRQQQLAGLREVRRINREREEAIARGKDPDEVAPFPEGIDVSVNRRPTEHEGATIASDYPNPEDMDREAMFAYLKAHGNKAHPASKDDTLRKKVREVRDGESEASAA